MGPAGLPEFPSAVEDAVCGPWEGVGDPGLPGAPPLAEGGIDAPPPGELPADELDDELELAEELELCEELLCEDELLWEEELLWEDELDGELADGGEGEGMLGGCGVRGVLALGHPLRTDAQASAAAAVLTACGRRAALPLRNIISPAKSFRIDRQPIAEARPEKRRAQTTHHVVGVRIVVRVVVEALDVHHAPPIRHPEF